MDESKIKILMTKPGLEGHYRGMLVVSNALRDAGFEVIYGGNMTPEEIASTAIQEDVDVIGMSILSANYMLLIADTVEELKAQGKRDVLLLLGGLIWKEDFPAIKEMGIAEIYTPGTHINGIVDSVRNLTAARV